MFGRRGSRPLSLTEMRNLFLDARGKPWYVSDTSGTSRDDEYVSTGATTR